MRASRLALVALAAMACGGPAPTKPTWLDVKVSFDASRYPLDQLAIDLVDGGQDLLPAMPRVPSTPGNVRSGDDVAVVVDAREAGHLLDVRVTGLVAGAAVVTGHAGGTVVAGAAEPVLVTLATPAGPPHATGLALSPAAGLMLAVGQSGALHATASFDDGSSQDVTAQADFASSATSVAPVDDAGARGTVQAIAAGSATVTARWMGFMASASVTVTATTPTLTGVTVAPASATLSHGDMVQLHATATYSDGSSSDVTAGATWTTSDGTIASVSAGLVVAGGAGAATVTATFDGKAGTAMVTVSAPTVLSVSVVPASATLSVGATLQLAARTNLSDGTHTDVTSAAKWSSSAPGIASVSTGGLARAVAAGTAAIYADYGGHVGSAALTVAAQAVSLQSLAIVPSTVTILRGTTEQFTATGHYSDGSTQDLTTVATWATSDTTLLTVGNGVTAGGLATTSMGLGTVSVTASYQGQLATASATVTHGALVSVAVSPSSWTAMKGQTKQFAATAKYQDGSTASVTSSCAWSSSDTTVVTVTSGGGLATAANAGSATITASCAGATGTATVTVGNVTLASIAVTPPNPSVQAGSTVQLAATGTYSDGSTQDLTASATWATASSSVATVSNTQHGLLTGVSAGTTDVSASYGQVAGHVTATVTPPPITVKSIAVTPPDPTLAVGETLAVTATATMSDGSTRDVSAQAAWSALPSGVATMNGATATARGDGTTTIAAVYMSVTGSTSLTVHTLLSIQLMPPTVQLTMAGDSTQVDAIGSYDDGATQMLDTESSWATGSSAVATVSAGLVSAQGFGTTTLTATYLGVVGNGTIDVGGMMDMGGGGIFVITPDPVTVMVSTTAQATCGTMSMSGFTPETCTWSITDTTVATVDANGLVKGVACGSTQISAMDSMGQTATATVDVMAQTCFK